MSKLADRGTIKAGPSIVSGQCLCGAVGVEIGVPARWAWHDHTTASRRAHGAAYATYVGSWRSRFRIIRGEDFVTRFDDPETRAVRSFCSRCGSPVAYERAHAPTMVNVPRALFEGGVGREPLYHIGIDQQPAWVFTNEPLSPLKGFPGVVRSRPKRRKRDLGLL
jgi:hypothetical protein